VVSQLDRLARFTLHLTQIAHDLEQRNINLVVIDQAIDTTTPTGKLLFKMLASIAEFETAIRAERQAEGIAKAQGNGVQFGAKPKVSREQVRELRQKRSEGVLIWELMAEYGLSKASVYRLL
jgi:DNA invertase Pin-like site-specific DNA recombinase